MTRVKRSYRKHDINVVPNHRFLSGSEPSTILELYVETISRSAAWNVVIWNLKEATE